MEVADPEGGGEQGRQSTSPEQQPGEMAAAAAMTTDTEASVGAAGKAGGAMDGGVGGGLAEEDAARGEVRANCATSSVCMFMLLTIVLCVGRFSCLLLRRTG